MTTQLVTLSGRSHDWLTWNTSWGATEGEPEVSRQTRAEVLATGATRRGRGWQYRVHLTPDQVADLFGILDAIAGALESMTAEERGDDGPVMRALRADAEKLRPLLPVVANADPCPQCGAPLRRDPLRPVDIRLCPEGHTFRVELTR